MSRSDKKIIFLGSSSFKTTSALFKMIILINFSIDFCSIYLLNVSLSRIV